MVVLMPVMGGGVVKPRLVQFLDIKAYLLNSTGIKTYIGLSPWFSSIQIIILLILPDSMGSSGANYAKNLLRAAILVQYIPRLYRFLPLLAGQSPSGFIFESAWANFVINLLTFVLSSHVVGSCWYLFGLQVGNFVASSFLIFLIHFSISHYFVSYHV